jgi:hypothetical protein
MEAITKAYMDWCFKHADRDDPVPDPPAPADSRICSIRVVDLFSESMHTVFNLLTADMIGQLFTIQKPLFYQRINILRLLLFGRASCHQHPYPHQSVLKLMLWSFIE